MEKNPHQHFVFKDKYLSPHHFIAKPAMIMAVFVYRDAPSSVYLGDPSRKVMNIAHVFLRPQDCQSFQLILSLKSAYQRLQEVLSKD